MNLKKVREEAKLTQKEVANILNTSDATYNRYELEKVKISVDDLIKLANHYNVSLDYLCNRPFNNNIGYIPESKKDAVRKMIELSDKNFDKVQGYISALSDSEK